jgi:hypothetical protein
MSPSLPLAYFFVAHALVGLLHDFLAKAPKHWDPSPQLPTMTLRSLHKRSRIFMDS